MLIKKRDGRTEDVKLEKIVKRIQVQSKGLKNVEPLLVASKVVGGVYDGVTSKELDELAIKTAANLAATHYEYDTLAARLSVSVLHKETSGSFSQVVEQLYDRKDCYGRSRPAVSEDFIKIVRKHHAVFDSAIIHQRDFEFDYLALETLKKSYLQKDNNKIIERPQFLWMRVAIGIHGKDINSALDTYEKLSKKLFTHATPTLFNAGTVKPQLASCFLLHMHDDSIEGIFKTISDCAKISQMAGGIGVHVHNIRSAGSFIYGTGGYSNGLVPMLRVLNSVSLYVDQCFSGKSPVYTSKGWKPIEIVEEGDKVLSSNGDFNVVKERKNFDYSGDLVTIMVGSQKIDVTPEHIFLCVREADHLTDVEIKEKIKRSLLELEWVTANDILKTDVVLGIK